MGMQEPDIRAGALDANQVTSNVIHATKNLTDNIQNGVNRTAQTLQAWQDRDFKAREAHKARQHDEWKFKEQLKTEVENANANRNAQMAKAMSDNITSMRNVDKHEAGETSRLKTQLTYPLYETLAVNGLTQSESFQFDSAGNIKMQGGIAPVLQKGVASNLLFSERGSSEPKDPNSPMNTN